MLKRPMKFNPWKKKINSKRTTIPYQILYICGSDSTDCLHRKLCTMIAWIYTVKTLTILNESSQQVKVISNNRMRLSEFNFQLNKTK